MRKVLLILALITPATAFAEMSAFIPNFGSKISISVSTSASSAASINAGEQVYCVNKGSETAFIACSLSSSEAATVADFPILGDSPAVFTCPSQGKTRYVSAITAASTTTLDCIPGDGL